MKKILVLCSGNSCRSQMAAAYLKFFTEGKAEVYSAGLHPTEVKPDTMAAMLDDNIDISHATAKGIEYFSGLSFDYLVTVCEEARLFKPADIHADEHFHFDIPSPYALLAEFNGSAALAFIKTRENIKREMLRFIGRTQAFLVPA